MAYDSVTGEKIERSTRDRRLSAGLSDAMQAKQSDEGFKRVWRMLFVAGLVDAVTAPDEYELRCPF
jgi:hypothetical protein